MREDFKDKLYEKLAEHFVFIFLITAKGQVNNAMAAGPFAALPWTTIERGDYSLQYPTGWKIDSSANELKIMPRDLADDSLVIYVDAFKMKVIPFNLYIKNPPVEYDAKTSISVNNKLTVYKVSSNQRCTNCDLPINTKKEQYYCVTDNKVIILYFLATDNALKKYNMWETIIKSFKLKKQ